MSEKTVVTVAGSTFVFSDIELPEIGPLVHVARYDEYPGQIRNVAYGRDRREAMVVLQNKIDTYGTL
jgi:hypothetical protein